jgi:3',5'-cyclic-nucleotide phosphodiesterase
MILTDEFARQASMEVELGIPSALFAPPVREIVELGQSQISFMNMFAIPLFQGVTDVMPAMQFCVDELHKNISIWAAKVEEEQKKAGEDPVTDGMFSPRAMSLANPSDAGSQQATNSPGTTIPKLDSSISGAQGNANKRSSRLEDISESDFQNASAKTSPTENAKATNGGIESEPLIPAVYSMAHRSGKPSPGHLQLSYATASAPGLLDHPSQAGHSLVTDAVVKDMPSPTAQSKPIDFQRTSDTTEGSNSVPGSRDWASQANSATTMGKLPLSPSTPGTSVMSDDSTERTSGVSPRLHTIDNPSRTLTNSTASQSCPAIPAASDHITGFTATTISADPSTEKQNGSGVTVMETMKSIVRKSSRSRFRMSFWKKKSGQGGLDVPPLPTGPMRASEEEMRGRSSGRS